MAWNTVTKIGNILLEVQGASTPAFSNHQLMGEVRTWPLVFYFFDGLKKLEHLFFVDSGNISSHPHIFNLSISVWQPNSQIMPRYIQNSCTTILRTNQSQLLRDATVLPQKKKTRSTSFSKLYRIKVKRKNILPTFKQTNKVAGNEIEAFYGPSREFTSRKSRTSRRK